MVYRRADNEAWDGFDASEAGYAELHSLYKHVTETRGLTATIIESDELGAAPEAGLKSLCHAIGVDFDRAMLSWRTDITLPLQWEGWAPFYERVQAAKGFESNQSPMPGVMPEEVELAAAQCLPAYEYLAARRIKFS